MQHASTSADGGDNAEEYIADLASCELPRAEITLLGVLGAGNFGEVLECVALLLLGCTAIPMDNIVLLTESSFDLYEDMHSLGVNISSCWMLCSFTYKENTM